ncbi:HAD family hydrolase [Vibrio breoganii]
MITLSNTTVVFDLDDTLYQEIDYQLSGYNSVIALCKTLYGQDMSNIVKQATIEKSDVLSAITHTLNLPESVKESLLWQYRLHLPDIGLSDDTNNTLAMIKKNAKHVAILTDGREISQKQKLAALGLSDLPVFISETWGETKPGSKRFKKIMQSMPSENYIYIGDNLNKDFVTPNKLGWYTIGIRDSGQNIHTQNIIVDEEYRPKEWLSSIEDLHQIII